jgi:sulfur carrier protein
MKVRVNRQAIELPPTATLAEVLVQIDARAPYAVAVNLQFVPRTRYAEVALLEGDEIEVITPVTGG